MEKNNSSVTWNTWWMQPAFGEGGVRPQNWGTPQHVYAPDLEYAFKMARTMWPTANSWRCLGAVDPKDPERVRSPSS